MTRFKLFKTSLIVITVMLWCTFPGLTQSVKEPGKNITTTASQAQINNKQNPNEVRIYNKEFARYNCSCDLHLKLVQSKTQLESGIASKQLSPEQIKQLKDRITAMENRLKNNGCESINNTRFSNKSVSSGQKPAELLSASKSQPYSRDQFMNLTVEEQRQLLTSSHELIITDLVNATPEMLKNRVDNINYIQVSTFKNADVKRKQAILTNPNHFVVVSDGTQIPKSKISQSQFDALPAAKKQAILDSGRYEITN